MYVGDIVPNRNNYYLRSTSQGYGWNGITSGLNKFVDNSGNLIKVGLYAEIVNNNFYLQLNGTSENQAKGFNLTGEYYNIMVIWMYQNLIVIKS